jgi:hypothetical protein
MIEEAHWTPFFFLGTRLGTRPASGQVFYIPTALDPEIA